MLLCDIGNTTYHFFKNGKTHKKSVKDFEPSHIKEKVYYISVNTDIDILLSDLENWIDVSLYLDFKKYYKTIGVDRAFACEAIDDGLILDAGSAITVDVIQDNIYQGGFIYPGINSMRNTYSSISKTLDYDFNFKIDTNILAKNSIDSISYGYIGLLKKEIDSYKKQIYLTGGDFESLKEVFRDAIVCENLIFIGMSKIIKEHMPIIAT